MKRIHTRLTALLLCAVCALGLCACRDDESSTSAESSHTSSAASDTDSQTDESSSSVDSTTSNTNSGTDESSTSTDSTASGTDTGTTLPLTDLSVMPENTYSDATILGDRIVVAAGTEKVPYRVILYNNPGYGFAGIRLTYGTALKPYLEEGNTAEFMDGAATDSFLTTCLNSPTEHMLGFAGFASDGADSKEDGIMFTCYFDIPADAASGTVYDFKLEVVDFNTVAGDAVAVDTVSGSITVQ